MPFQKVARVEDVPPGQTRFLRIGGRPLLLVNSAGLIHAFTGICPHRQFPLEGATLSGHLLDCPWHHFQYDVRTGENHYPRNVYPSDLPYLQAQLQPLRRYPVQLRDDEIWVDLT